MIDYTKVFYTVPMLTEKLIRDSNGKKIDHLYKPEWKSKIRFDGDWQDYIQHRNTKNTPLLGAIANEEFIGIDIDNNPLMDQLYEVAKEHCKYVAVSLPIDANKGGHLLFRYDKASANILQYFLRALKQVKIDVQMGPKLIFLATPANTTKRLITPELTQLDDLTFIPPTLLQEMVQIAIPIQQELNATISTSPQQNSLPETTYGYMLQGILTPNIVKELTPRQDYPNITQMDDIPAGSATDWLLKVRKKLQVDKSVSPEVFEKSIRYLASLWSVPRGPVKQLDLDIRRDLKHIDWKYDEKWNLEGFIYPTTLEHAIEVYYDDTQQVYIQHNTYTNDINQFVNTTALVNSIISTHKARKKFTGEQILKKSKTVRLVNTPELTPLLTYNTPHYPFFNLHKPSYGVRVLQQQDDVKEYKHPTNILEFLENLMPDQQNRDRFMQFIAHKHKTYEHSPLYFVLAGVGGAGKGVLVNIILRFIAGDDRLQQADLQSITNNFNSWMSTTDWLEIEEAGEGYSQRDNAQLVGTLKKLTGNKYLTVEKKGKDRDASIRHYMTPIISTNMNTKLITDTINNDRRLVLFRCPNKLSKITDNTREFIAQMQQELPSFCQYLRDLPIIDYNDYIDNKNWKSEEYEEYIYETTSVVDRLYEAAEMKDLDKFILELTEASISYADIDEMFAVSTNRGARCLLYNTSASLILNTQSLEDISTKNPNMDTNIRAKFKPVKQRRDAMGVHNMKINVIEFTGIYQPLSAPSIDPINSADLEID